ncbi:MAG: hypothetical protein R2754_05395 [Microthrixaceae bacterium]
MQPPPTTPPPSPPPPPPPPPDHPAGPHAAPDPALGALPPFGGHVGAPPPGDGAPLAAHDLSLLPPPPPPPDAGSTTVLPGGLDPKWLAAGAGVVVVGLAALGVMTLGLGMRPITALALTAMWGVRMGSFVHGRANGRQSGGRRKVHAPVLRLIGVAVAGLIVARMVFGGPTITPIDSGSPLGGTPALDPVSGEVVGGEVVGGEVFAGDHDPFGGAQEELTDGFCVPGVQPPDPDC